MKYFIILLLFAGIISWRHPSSKIIHPLTYKSKIMTYPVLNINISIYKPTDEVYSFASNPEYFPQWIAFMKVVKKDGDKWIAQTDLGTINIKMAEPNKFGIMDHEVILTNGQVIYNPMRVIANNEGSEMLFTLFRLPGVTDSAFNKDAENVRADLHSLKMIMENNNH